MPRQYLQRLIQHMLIFSMIAPPAYSQSIITDYTPYQALPTTPLPAANNSGVFLWPLTGSVELYEIGSMMNISWSSKFSRTNLWLIPNFDWSSPVALLSDTSSTNYEWTVQCLGDCKVPWLVRATNAEGDSDAQMNGGFVSAEFWIMPGEDSNSTIADASASSSIHTTTLIKSTITVSPPRITSTIRLNNTSAATSIKGPGPAKATTTTFKMPATSTTHSTSHSASPTTSQATLSETPSPSPTRESGSPVLGATANHGIIFGVILGAAIGWYF